MTSLLYLILYFFCVTSLANSILLRRHYIAFIALRRLFSISIGSSSHYRPLELYKRANVLATLSWLPPSAAAAPNLELIQFFSAGTNHVVKHPVYTDSDIPLTTASGIHGPQIAEWYCTTWILNYLYDRETR
jgi:phosphoglycerate dehydrogenase-like enzyme